MSSFIDLSGISLPTDWYKLQISNGNSSLTLTLINYF